MPLWEVGWSFVCACVHTSGESISQQLKQWYWIPVCLSLSVCVCVLLQSFIQLQLCVYVCVHTQIRLTQKSFKIDGNRRISGTLWQIYHLFSLKEESFIPLQCPSYAKHDSFVLHYPAFTSCVLINFFYLFKTYKYSDCIDWHKCTPCRWSSSILLELLVSGVAYLCP